MDVLSELGATKQCSLFIAVFWCLKWPCWHCVRVKCPFLTWLRNGLRIDELVLTFLCFREDLHAWSANRKCTAPLVCLVSCPVALTYFTEACILIWATCSSYASQYAFMHVQEGKYMHFALRGLYAHHVFSPIQSSSFMIHSDRHKLLLLLLPYCWPFLQFVKLYILTDHFNKYCTPVHPVSRSSAYPIPQYLSVSLWWASTFRFKFLPGRTGALMRPL